MIRFGPAGIGSVKDAIFNLNKYNQLGLKACEIPFTYGIYIKKEEDAKKIKEAAKKLGIKLSIHAPYWINLNSADDEKINKSRQRILECCRVGSILGAERVIFHPGYYGKRSKEETYKNIKKEIQTLQKEIEKKGYDIKLAPETMGKVNVFGSVEEILNLVEDTGCDFCIDFAHILARDKDYKFQEVLNKLKKFNNKEIHLHFSGIIYGESGEKYHKKTPEKDLKDLIENLLFFSKEKDYIIINESPEPVEDSVVGIKIYKSISSL